VGGKRAITATKVKFAKSTVYFTLAASEAQLASRPVKRLILDEEDKFPRSTKNEGSPQDQAKRRTRTYRDAITIRASTPTRKRGPIWTALQRSDWRKWFVPCLTCGHYAPWEFSQVIFPERVVKDGGRQESLEEWAQRIDNGADAGYACAECGAVARGRGAQTEMNRRGEWRPTRVGNRGVVGFQTSSLTSPDVTWSEFAVRFLEAKAEERRGWPEKMRDFRLHDLAEPWEPARVAMEEDAVVSRTVALRAGIVPRFHRVLGVGIDCQDDRVYVVLMSGAPDPLSLHVVAYAELRGPLDAALAAAEDFAVDRAFPDESKESRMVNAALADSGDWHHQPVVYTWTSRSKRRFPLKGASKALGGGALVRRNTNKKADHKGKLVNVCPLGTGRMLDTLLAAPPLAQPGTGLGITFCAEAGEDEEFQRQVVSEEYDEDSDGYVMREGYLENHFRDACRYAMAALAVAGVFRGRGQGKRRAKMRPKWKPGAGGRR
jgi:phage terminase large subunit GpA-like protein